MAKIVIAGSADCPRFARVELLADDLAKNLPNFHLHKIVKAPSEWKNWLDQQCNEKGWKHCNSPLIWRELVNRGGKGVLIGGANEFQEYAKAYYDIESSLLSTDMLEVAKNNVLFKEDIDAENEYLKSQIQPMRVCITCASQPIAYHLIPAIAKGAVFGPRCDISLVLYDSDADEEVLSAIQMESTDLAEALVHNVTVTDDLHAALQDCGVVILLDEIPQEPEESNEDWLKRHEALFSNYGKAIDAVCYPETKVVVCGSGPVNFCTTMLMLQYTRMQSYNTVALARNYERQIKSVLAKHMAVNSAGIVDAIVWGNPTGCHHIDLTRCRVYSYDGSIVGPSSFSQPTEEVIWDKKWLKNEFPQILSEHNVVLRENLGHSAAICAAHSIAEFLCHWWNGSNINQIFSLGVCSNGLYNVPSDLIFSFPVTLHPKGYYTIIQDMEMSDELYDKINEAIQDLRREYEVIFPPPKPPTPEVEESPRPPSVEEDEDDTEEIRRGLLELLRPKVESEFPDDVEMLLEHLGRLEIEVLQPLTSEDQEEELKSRCINILNGPSDSSEVEPTDSEVERPVSGVSHASGAGRELGKIKEEDEPLERPSTEPAPPREGVDEEFEPTEPEPE